MSRPAILTERIKGCYFRKANIKIKRFDAINYVVSPQFGHIDRAGWNGPETGLTLCAPQMGVQSPRLSAGESYLLEFRVPGVFTVQFQEDPTISQCVIVEERAVFPDTESDSRESASFDSNIHPRGLFPSCQSVSWQKRPRSKLKQTVEKKFAKKKDTTSESQNSGQKKSKKSQKSSTEVLPSQHQPLVAPEAGSPGPSKISHEQILSNFENSPQLSDFDPQAPKIVQDKTGGISEQYRLAGMDAEAIRLTFQTLKLKYEKRALPSPIGSSLDELAAVLVQTFDRTEADGPLEIVVPKGHSNRRLRRARQRFEMRFNGL